MSRPSRNGELADSASSGGSTRAQVVADRDRPVGAPDADVHVHAPGVVSLRHPAQLLAQPVVVLGVDDLLIEVVRPGVRAGRGERDPEPLGEREQAAPAFALQLDRLGEATRRGRSGSRSRCRSARRRPSRRALVGLQAPKSSSKRCTSSRLEGSTRANSSSRPMVKSCEASKTSRMRSRSRRLRAFAAAHRPELRRGRSRARRAGRPPGSRCAR